MVRITTGRFKTAFTAAERPLTKSVYKALQAPIYEEQAPQKKGNDLENTENRTRL